MTVIDAEFRDAISEYLKRSKMSARRLGELALDDPEFVADLNDGASPGLDTVDRVLRFMDIAPIGPRFRREVEAFLIVTRTSPTLVGTRAVGKSSFVRELRSGASPTLDRVARVRFWMHAAADDFQRTGIAWLLASDVTVPPYGLGTAFPPWTDDDEQIPKIDERTFLTPREAATVVGLSSKTLESYRVSGEGPGFHKFGRRVLYARFDLEVWAKARLGRRLPGSAFEPSKGWGRKTR